MPDPASSPDFYVVARQPGAENPAIPTWANHGQNPAALAHNHDASIERVEIESVPGAFQLRNLLGVDECQRLRDLSETLGYLEDAAVSLPRSIRHNHSFTWVVDDETCDLIWRRCAPHVFDNSDYNAGKAVLGLNARFRFYRYRAGDYFAPHTDGSWPGSKVIDGRLIDNAYDDRWSQLTCLLFLSDDYEGGATRFYVNKTDATLPARHADDADVIELRTPLGGALFFPHGTHPEHCMHGSQRIDAGSKYIIRSDVLFEI